MVKTSLADIHFANRLLKYFQCGVTHERVMRYPTLRRVTFAFELRILFRTNDEQDDSSGQRQPSEYRRDGNVFLIFPGGVNRPNVQNLFLTGVIESLIGEGQPAQNN